MRRDKRYKPSSFHLVFVASSSASELKDDRCVEATRSELIDVVLVAELLRNTAILISV
jgi:hypothetical protein